MATIETDADVVRVIRENPRILFRALHEDPELLAEVRRLVLTEEVLAMPAQLAEVIERQDRTEGQLAEVIERQDRTEGQLAEVIRIQNSLLTTQNEMLTTQNEMRDHIGELRGAELERQIVWILPTRLNLMYDLYRPRITQRRGDQTPYTQPFLDEIEDARLASVISDEQWRRIQETDMIVQARRNQDQSVTYIAVEASATIRQSDIVRAKSAADALQEVFEVETESVAAGYRIRSEDRRRAEDMGVSIVILDEPNS